MVDIGVDGSKFLQRLHLSKPQHGSLTSSEWEMTVFSSIVEPPSHLASFQVSKFTHCCRVRHEAIGDDCFDRPMMLERLLEEAHGFVTDVDTAFRKQIFPVPQAQRKPHIHHHNKPDNLRR